ncbi:MAG: Holliday junction DNA helicase RuvA [Desulfobacteraceae bacterium]|nr:Holliday junction DNA helicase RuvA [Desulfobacteraceae bacterium]
MIGYLEGKLLKVEAERMLILAAQVGYEVMLPAVVMKSLATKSIGDTVSLFIYYHQTERQPKPVLIGFTSETEKEFFQLFISVDAIGPLKAVKAMDIPVSEIASAIESKDLGRLKALKGIGGRTAQKIIASLQGKAVKFVVDGNSGENAAYAVGDDLIQQVLDVLVGQLGHKLLEAKKMVVDALKRNPDIATAEALFEEVYRGEKEME